MSNERSHDSDESLSIDAGTLQLLWFGILVYLDFQTTIGFLDTVTIGTQRFIMLKSIVLIGTCMVVMRFGSASPTTSAGDDA